MGKEKIILSIVAVLVGLLVAGAGFYIYQGSKTLPQSLQDTISVRAPTPTPASVLLQIDEPKDEQVYDKKLIDISGKTDPEAIIVILTHNAEEVITPSKLGNFKTTITLENGENLIEITAIAKNGESTTVNRTVTYSTESF